MSKVKSQVNSTDDGEELEGKESIELSPAFQQELNNALAKLAPGREKLQAVQEYRNIKINGIDDKENYDKAVVALRDTRTYRGTLKKDKKIIKDPLQKAMDEVDSEFNYLWSGFIDVEKMVKAEKEPIDALREKRDEEKKALKQKRYTERSQELLKLGAEFNGREFVLNDVVYSLADIEGLDDDVYSQNVLPLYKAEWQKAEDERIAEKKRQDDKDAELKKQQDEFEKKQKEFREQQAKFEKQKQEHEENLKAEKEKKDKARCLQLEALGMTYVFGENAYVFGDTDISIKMNTELKTWDDNHWNAVIGEITPVIEAYKAEAERKASERIALLTRGNSRVAMLRIFNSVGHPVPSEEVLGNLDDDQWESLQSSWRNEDTQIKHKAWLKEQDDLKEKKRQEDELKLNEEKDHVKWAAIVDHLKKTPIVDMTSKKYQDKFEKVRDFLSDIEAL